MKTRIKIQTLKNGNKIYYPQYKGLFLWRHFLYSSGYDSEYREKYDSLEECQKFIDAEIVKRAELEGKQVSSVEYVKYP